MALEYELRCSYCGSTDIVSVDGEYVCRSCGTVLGQSLTPHVLSRVRVIGTVLDFTTLELYAVEGEIKRLVNVLGLQERCVKEATRLAEYIVRGRMVTVRQPEALAVATLLYSCRRVGTPVRLRLFIRHVSTGQGSIRRAVWELSRILPVRYEDLLVSAARAFGAPPDAVLNLWRKYRRKLNGKNPRVVAATLIYWALHGRVSRTEVANRLGVTVHSMRETLKRLS